MPEYSFPPLKVHNRLYTLSYDAENHVTDVSGDTSAAYVYDGDGQMVEQDTSLGTTLYIGNHYEYFIPKTGTIGEVGQVNNLTGVPRTIVLSRHYENPVVFALPHSSNGSATSVVRIKDVQKDRFTFYVQNINGSHGAAETVSYIVLEAGSWQLPDGTLLEVGTLDTSMTHSASPEGWENVKFRLPFAGTPAVISQVQSNNDPHYIHTRQKGASATGFSVALEEDDIQSSPHGTETVGWLAIQPSSGVWNGHAYRAGNTPNAVTHSWYTISFSPPFSQAPRFIAWMPTMDGGDPAGLRYKSLTATYVQVRVEEDTTLDSETYHTTEVVSYLAIQGNGALTGKAYTPNGHSETKYYYAGSQRVAMRVNGALYYLFSDHLGSTGIVADAQGNKVSELRYDPWGEVRYAWGAQVTDYTYTGQRSMADAFGLMYYNARWYDPTLGRFAQADTLIPGAGNPLAWDRYAYTRNNPLRYTDPSGHWLCSGEHDCSFRKEDVILPPPPRNPWKNDPDYDPASDSLPNWGTDQSEAWRQARAAKVWSWICTSGGWWGAGCPDADKLAAWLLQNELGLLLRDDILKGNKKAQRALILAVTYIKDLFTDGISSRDLSKFTAFFNPHTEFSGSFDAMDWADLMRKPSDAALRATSYYWKLTFPYPGRDLVWRTPGERNGPTYSQHLFDVTYPGTENIILEFGLR